MKIKSGYVIRKVMDVYVILGVGSGAYTPNRIMSVNETGAFLWDRLSAGSTEKELLDCLVSEYGVDRETAENDVRVFLEELRERSLIEEC